MQMESVAAIAEAHDEGVLANVIGAANDNDEGILMHLVLWISVKNLKFRLVIFEI